MGEHPRAAIIDLPPSTRDAGALRRAAGPGVIVRLWEHPGADERRNEAWDRLLALAERLWTWRDPETLEEFEDCLLRLSLAVETEWA